MSDTATHAASPEPALPPEIAEAATALKSIVRTRAHELRESGALPPGTRAGVEAWTVSGIDGVEIWMRVPAVYLRDEAAKAYARSVSELAARLFDEFTRLLAEHQPAPGPRYRAFVTICLAGHRTLRTGQ